MNSNIIVLTVALKSCMSVSIELLLEL